MQTYITFLRGVNMTGHNTIKMNELSALFTSLGYSDVETYIQSGNVIFNVSDDNSSSALSENIESAILKRFKYTVPAIIRTYKELKELCLFNPFINELNFDPSKMAILFLHEEPSDNQINKVAGIDYPPDKFKIIGKEIFLYCPNGFGKTKLYTNFFEKKMSVTGTARNWKTITTLLEIMEKKL
jgi:uncharacterized protein (DUF1697 family)